MIPIMIPYQKDEFLYSWICRLAIENGFKDDIREFMQSYVCLSDDLCFDVTKIEPFAINLHEKLRRHLIDLYLETSLYPFLSIFLTNQLQTKYLNKVFRKYQRHSSFTNDQMSRAINELKICPICKNEELDKLGFYYYHRSHQLPGVKVCTKHKCQLHRYTGQRYKIFTQPLKTEIVPLKATIDVEYQYAAFVEELLHANLDINKQQLCQIIEDELTKQSFDGYEEFKNTVLKNRKLTPLMSDRAFSRMKRINSIGENSSAIVDLSAILLGLFKTVDKIPKLKQPSEPNKEQIYDKENYKLISKYRNNIVELKHCTCGYSYITSGTSFTQGWRCPFCDITIPDNQKFKKILYHSTNGEYELSGDFHGWDSSITITHCKCGRTYTPKAGRLIFDENHCSCTLKMPIEDIKKKLSCYEKYKLVEVINGQHELKILALDCEHLFVTSLRRFINKPVCPICQSKPLTHLSKKK